MWTIFISFLPLDEIFGRDTDCLDLAHRLGKAADRLFSAPSRRAVGNNRDLLDAGFLDALDLRAALIDRCRRWRTCRPANRGSLQRGSPAGPCDGSSRRSCESLRELSVRWDRARRAADERPRGRRGLSPRPSQAPYRKPRREPRAPN